MNILFIVFGDNVQHHLQANFSICTFLAQKEKQITVNIITDRPAMYNAVAEEVNLIPVEEELLNKWKGDFDFFWRIKIKAIQHLCTLFPGQHILYLDSDTFLFWDISFIIDQLNNGCSFMHLCEGEWRSAKSKTEKKMWAQINNNTYGNVLINEKHKMWNAGVIGIPGKSGMEIIEKSLLICDDMLKDNVTKRLIEQYAFSVALADTTKLLEAQNQIGHYWSNKDAWNQLINDFFMDHYLKHTSKEEIIASVKNIDFSLLPVYTDKHNTRERLKKIIEAYFPDRKKVFIPTRK